MKWIFKALMNLMQLKLCLLQDSGQAQPKLKQTGSVVFHGNSILNCLHKQLLQCL